MMRVERLPATQVARQDIVLLHGWGCSREVWRALLPYLRPWANITLVDIPGCCPGIASESNPTADEVAEYISNIAPQRAIYVGWSLGGQLATYLARTAPERVAALVTLCSNPRFVAHDHWPGMAPHDFAEFQRGVADDTAAALRRFDGLQTRGSVQQRTSISRLRALRGSEVAPSLCAGIDWLGSLDLRAALITLAVPQLHLLAEQDALVPAALADALRTLLAAQQAATITTLQGLSHAALMEAPEKIAATLYDFALQHGLLDVVDTQPAQALEKTRVAASFSRAAQAYDSVAGLQRDVGKALLGYLAQCKVQPRAVLDLGSGTGHFRASLRERFPRAQYIGLDIAEGMVRYARRGSDPGSCWLVGDAEALPLAADSVDLVFSSLSIQWCERPEHFFAELARVLRPGGCCVFTSLGPRTLHELRSAWASVDAHQHVNSFLATTSLLDAARKVPGIEFSLETRDFQMRYARVRDLLNELKTLGAHNMNRERAQGLTSRRTLQAMLQSYEAFRQDGVLPATYEVLFGVVQRPDIAQAPLELETVEAV